MENLEHTFTVSELNHLTKEVLEQTFVNIWLEGEVSNFMMPSSGHYYFSLKDDTAQVRCAFFRGQQQNTEKPENGMHVLVKARVSLYEPRGEFQLIIQYLEPAGAGLLHRAFEVLKKRLDKAGLFALEHKKPLPPYPQCVGIITSPTGAAIHDILTTLKRRCANLSVIIYPTAVQGVDAAAQIVRAIHLAEQRQECDVLIVARGGGSLEDLWPFNEEIVARAVFAAKIPIISAIGHEVDFTITDWVADLRAATPTAAAELVCTDQQQELFKLQQLRQRLQLAMKKVLQQARQHFQAVQKQLKHPGQYVREKQQQLDYLEQNLRRVFLQNIQQKHNELLRLRSFLLQHSPLNNISNLYNQQSFLKQRLIQTIKQRLQRARQHLQYSMQALDTVSPLATLQRGYALVTDDKKLLISSIQSVHTNEHIDVQLVDGHLKCEVMTVIPLKNYLKD